MSKRVLAFSSSRVASSGYLEQAGPVISNFLGRKVSTVAFIPFAAVDEDYEGYCKLVQDALAPFKLNIRVVLPYNAANVIEASEVIMTGGGNTFKLLHDLYELD